MHYTRSKADFFADIFDWDGQNFTTAAGCNFDDVLREMSAEATFARRVASDDPDVSHTYVDGCESDHRSGDPIRYEFSDGSAIVLAGTAWDIEGDERYSWVGA